jgi:pimeloyl-ACP methyl ester carboxylesterase
MRLLVALVVLLVVTVVGPPLAASLFGYAHDPSALPPEGRLVTIGNGKTLNVVEQGSGPIVILVHGLPSSAYDWGQTPEKLAALGHRVIAYDRVGYGYSSRAQGHEGEYTYESNAADLAALMNALGIESATLVGWSYGGAVVQTFAESRPGRAAALVLVGSVGPGDWTDRDVGSVDLVLESRFGASILRWVASIPPLSRAMTRETLVRAFGAEEDLPDGYVEYTRAMLSLPGTFDAFVYEARRGDENELRPANLAMPGLIIQGTNDRLVPYAVGRELDRSMPHSRLVTVKNGGHMLPITHPTLVANEIHDFVAALQD